MTSPIRVREIDLVVLRVQDLKSPLRFYCEVLGCEKEREIELLGLVQPRAGQSLIDLVPIEGELGRLGGAGPGAGDRNVDHIALRIEMDNLADVVPFLDQQYVAHGDIERRYGAEGYGRSLYLQDPDRNVVELRGNAEPST